MSSATARAIPCPVCKAPAGERCSRLDNGQPRKVSHRNRTPVQPCGSYGAYQKHRKAGEEPCEPCREAGRRYMAEYRNRRPESREKDIRALRLRNEAARLLIQRHEAEFRALLSVLAGRESA